MTAWLGVDPGGTGTGLVLMRPSPAPVLLDHDVVVNDTGETGHAYLARVLAGIARIVGDHARVTGLRDTVQVAVEEVTPPTGFAGGKRHPIDPGHLIGCAIVQGAVMAVYPDTVLVPPGGNGHGAYAAYPVDLITAGEQRVTGWQLRPAGQASVMRHARSAWDVARRAAQAQAVAARGRVRQASVEAARHAAVKRAAHAADTYPVAAALYAQGRSITDVAEATGVSYDTALGWRQRHTAEQATRGQVTAGGDPQGGGS